MKQEREINVVVLGPRGYLSARDQLEKVGTHTRLGFEKAWWQGMVSFHRNGRRYKVRTAGLVQPLAAWVTYVPALLYNPVVKIAYEFEEVGDYSIEELVAAVEAAVREDDDIITQFRDADDLRERLSRAKTFDAVTAVLAYARVGV